jgi:mono/diheme cytochrome c family protein
MQRHTQGTWIRFLAASSLVLGAIVPSRLSTGVHAQAPPASLALPATRASPLDLEIGGELTGLPPGTTRYIPREDLLALPQQTYTVTDDANFKGATEISGVSLEELTRHLGATPQSDMVVAICDDQYRTNYPRAYVAAHHPLLVLNINGKPPSGWPKDSEGHGLDMGPFLISHPKFTPSFKILSHEDEPQIPWGVVRLEFRDEKAVFGAIAPRGLHAVDPAVQAGYRIALQNCFRCHNMGHEGGTKAGRSWLVLAAYAASSPDYFAAYVRNPRSQNPQAQMPAMTGYDDRTIAALAAYFREVQKPRAQQDKRPEKRKSKGPVKA